MELVPAYSPPRDHPHVVALVRVLVWVYGLSWIGDFRGEQGGAAVQFLMFAVTVGSAFTLMILGVKTLFRRPLGWLVLMWWLFLLSTAAVALVRHVNMSIYVRMIGPWLLVGTSMAVCAVASGFGLRWQDALYPMLISSAGNVVWRAVYALKIAGIDPEKVRVEMLSQSLPMIMALMTCGMALQRNFPRLPLILGGMGIASYIFSITRSAIFVIGAAAIGAVVALLRSKQLRILPEGFGMAKSRHMLAGAGALFAVLVLLGVGAPFVFERWAERLFNPVGADRTSMDPSALTRLSEHKAFWDIMKDEPGSYLFGMGIAQTYYWDESFATELSYTYGNIDIFRSEYREINFPGHTIWTYAFFSGGIFGLLIHTAFFIMIVRNGWRAGSALRHARQVPLEIGWLSFAGVLAFISASVTFNPFIERSAGIVLGFLAGFPQFIFREADKTKKALAEGRVTV